MKRMILLSFGAAMFLAACNQFLEYDSPAVFTDEYIGRSEEEMFRAVSGVYEGMLNFTKAKYYNDLNLNTDVEFTSTSTEVPRNDGNDYNVFESTSYAANTIDTWGKIYAAVNRANDVIEIIEKSPLYQEADRSAPSLVTHMYGEVKTLRAMIYLELVRNWGDVPFRLNSSRSDEDLYVPATDRDTILTTMIQDLVSVEPGMLWASELPEGTERVSRAFCQGMIARIALTRGGWHLRPDLNDPSRIGTMKRSSDYLEYYEIARKYAEKLIQSGQHSLTLPFRQVFRNMSNYVIQRNDDIIFEIAALRGYSGEVGSSLGFPVEAGSHPYGKGTGSTNLLGTYILDFDKEDLRRDVTCALYKYDSELNQVFDANPMKMYTAKWSVLYMDNPIGKDGNGKSIGINFPYMRYADVLLMYAEALNELQGPTPQAREALKAVRQRAFAEEHWDDKVENYVNSLNSKEDFFNALVHERKLEFGLERVRQHDLARWNLYGKVIYDLYFSLIEMGKDAHGVGSGNYGQRAAKLYYTSLSNSGGSMPGNTVLLIKGLDEYIDTAPLDESGKPYASKDYLAQLWKTSSNQPDDKVKWSFRGYINPNNAASVNPQTDPVRYLLPIPYKVINSYKGKLKNYYGFE